MKENEYVRGTEIIWTCYGERESEVVRTVKQMNMLKVNKEEENRIISC